MMTALRLNILHLSITIISLLVQNVDSSSLIEDRNAFMQAAALMNTYSAECSNFTLSASREAIGSLTGGQLCDHLKSTRYKSRALEACTKKEYEATVDLACSVGLTNESSHRENSTGLNEDTAFGKSWVALMTSFSLECKRFAVGSRMESIANLSHDTACRRVKSPSFKSSALEVCSHKEYDSAFALACGKESIDESRHQKSSTTLSEDKGFIKRWVILVKSLSVKCKAFAISDNRKPIGSLTHDAACDLVKSNSFKSSALKACSQDEYGRVLTLMCRNTWTFNEDKGFNKSLVAMLKSFSQECERFTLGQITETMDNFSFGVACHHMKSNSFESKAREACNQDEYDAAVALMCNGVPIIQSRNHDRSILLIENKKFLGRWVGLVEAFSQRCKKFAYTVSTYSIADLTFEAACKHVKSDKFKSIALEACSQAEYNAAIDLVCNVESMEKSGDRGRLPTWKTDIRFVKRWVAFVRTLSIVCRDFLITVSTGPFGDLTLADACRYGKSVEFKSRALESCSQSEYGAAVARVCGGKPGQYGPILKDDKDFSKRWIRLVGELSLKCQRFVLYSSLPSIDNSPRDEACRRVTSHDFQSRAIEVCSVDEYGAVEELVCPSESSRVYFAYTTVFLCIFIHSLIQG